MCCVQTFTPDVHTWIWALRNLVYLHVGEALFLVLYGSFDAVYVAHMAPDHDVSPLLTRMTQGFMHADY